MNIVIEHEDFNSPVFQQVIDTAVEQALAKSQLRLPKDEPEKLLLNADPAAEALSMSRRTLDKLTAQGKISVVRITSRPQYSRQSLKKFIEEQEQKGCAI